MTRIGVFVTLGALLSAFAPQQTPKFVAGVDVVEMDVSVRDKDHKPVRGLTAADFTIFEDGVAQKIVAFDEMHVPPPAPPSAPWKRDVPADVVSNAVADKQLFVIVVDDAQITPSSGQRTRPGETPPGDPMMKDAAYRLGTTRSVARRAIELLGDNDLAAILFTLDNFKGQTFTSDRSKLLKTLDGLTLGPFFGAYINDPQATDCQPLWDTTGALRMAVEALSAVPYRRKTIIYVSAGLYIPLLGEPPPEYKYCAGKAQEAVLEAFRMAQLANVNVYTIDPSGLEVPVDGLEHLRGRHNFLLEVAENTGGRAVLDTNDDVGRVAEVFEDARSYYVLGYELKDRKGDGKFHRVEVKVDRPGVDALSRKTRYDTPPPKPGTAAAVVSAENVVGEFLPKGDIPAEASVSPFQSGTGGTVLVSLGGRLPPLSSPLTSDHLDLLIRAFTPDGRDAGAHQELVPVILRPADPPAGDQPASGPAFELASRIDLKAGRYSLRIGLRSAATDKAGSVYADVTVPDFGRDPLSLSGIVFTASAGTSRSDALSAIVPTVSREFPQGGRMQAFLRVYQGGATPLTDVSMRMRVVDGHNAAVMDHTEILPAQAFARGRQADYFARLPLSGLKPGEYWLAIEARAGRATERRDARFTVK